MVHKRQDSVGFESQIIRERISKSLEVLRTCPVPSTFLGNGPKPDLKPAPIEDQPALTWIDAFKLFPEKDSQE